MTVYARTFASTPARTATETWEEISDLLNKKEEGEVAETLGKLNGIASTIIVSEIPSESPIVIFGDGPRIRIYCAYDDKALDNSNLDENPLPDSPVGDGWGISFPCKEEDIEWIQKKLDNFDNISVRDPDEEVKDNKNGNSENSVEINSEEFFKS